MSNLSAGFIILAILSLVVAFLGRHMPIVDGIGKALFGVFVILFLIVRLFGEKEEA